MSTSISQGFQDYLDLPNRPLIALITNINRKVADREKTKATAVRSRSAFIVSASTLSETARQTMKNSRGTAKATTTLDTSEGPLLPPSFW
jgi:hypothetical protein